MDVLQHLSFFLMGIMLVITIISAVTASVLGWRANKLLKRVAKDHSTHAETLARHDEMVQSHEFLLKGGKPQKGIKR